MGLIQDAALAFLGFTGMGANLERLLLGGVP